ncbi:MAG: anthranilate synthase component I [Elusimicrobiota bacterium]
MYFPTRNLFLKKAKKGNIVPIYKEILADQETPVSAFMRFKDKADNIYMLESVEGNTNVGRYTFLGVGADTIITSKSKMFSITTNGETNVKNVDSPIKELERIVREYKPAMDSTLPPFYGGAVGYFGYDIVRFYENIPHEEKQDTLDVPDIYFMISKDVIIFDRVTNSIKIVANAHVGKDKEAAYDDAVNRIKDMEQILLTSENVSADSGSSDIDELVFTSNTSKKDFMKIVERGKEYIRQGDILQVVLSQRWMLDKEIDPFAVYRHLRTINPSPYMFFLKLGDMNLIGSSPEVMVKGGDGKIIVRPIAGTRPRGADEEQDNANEKELLSDEKERAEHVMLVDLGRNDLGRIAVPGTVKVEDCMVIERYSHVMHIVSQVSAKLDDNVTWDDVLRAAFPAGTVSGAPKIRAMEIIEELEREHRGAYAGAVSYLAFSGNFDTCITIRTIVQKDNKLYFQAGAGIVADSNPESEYYETVNKIKVLFSAVADSLGMSNIEFLEYEKDNSIIVRENKDSKQENIEEEQ